MAAYISQVFTFDKVIFRAGSESFPAFSFLDEPHAFLYSLIMDRWRSLLILDPQAVAYQPQRMMRQIE